MVAALEARFGEPTAPGRSDLIGSFVRTILSQNTSDANSGPAYDRLREKFPTWEAVARARPRSIASAIRRAGLADQKAPRIRDFVRWVKDQFGEYDLSALRRMPDDEIIETMVAVKGIGIKTVTVVMLFSLGRDVFPVDTHVHRVCRRVGLVPETATAEQTYERMAPLVPDGKALSLHVNLLRLGRTICRARAPNCPGCPLRRVCAYAKARAESG